MEAKKSIFSIYFAYFVFAMLMHSIFITIEQSIYVYAIDKGKAFNLLIMNYIGIISAAIFLPNVLSKISYKKLLLFFLIVTGLVCLPMPFTSNLNIPQIVAFVIGLMYGANRIATYAFLKNIYPKEQVYASILNRLDAMFALGFIITWGIFGGLIIFSFSWLIFYGIMVACLLLAIIQVALSKYMEEEKVLSMEKQPDETTISKNVIQNLVSFAKNSPVYFIQFLKGILNSIMDLLNLMRNSMSQIFTVSVVLLSLIQIHFMKSVTQIGEQFSNIPSIDTYFMVITFLSLFLGRIFSSFLLRIFQSIYVVTTSLVVLGCLILFVSMASVDFNSDTVIHFHELPSSVWLIPMMGFFWAPVMPTLFAVAFFNLESKKIYTLAGIVIIAIFGTEAFAGGISELIFRQFTFNIALILGIIPVVLLLMFSLLFINDLKNTTQSKSEKFNPLYND